MWIRSFLGGYTDGYGLIEANGLSTLPDLESTNLITIIRISPEMGRKEFFERFGHRYHPPVLELVGELYHVHDAGTPFVDLGVRWLDAVDGNGTILGSGVVEIMELESILWFTNIRTRESCHSPESYSGGFGLNPADHRIDRAGNPDT